MVSDPAFLKNQADRRTSDDGESSHIFKDTTQNISQQVKSQARSILSNQKNRVIRQLESMANVLKQSSGKMREQQNDSAARLTEIGADGLERFAGQLRRTDPDNIVSQVQDFARRRPAVVAGAALAAGFVLGQILSDFGKARSVQPESLGTKAASSLEYRPGEDEEGYYERH